MGDKKPVVCYWAIRGLGEPVRLLLSHAGVDFEDKRIGIGGMGEWQRDKYNLGLDFPNLPYYIDGKTKLTQCMAILRFLGHKHGMAPKTEEERTRADLVAEQLLDLRNGFVKLCYGEDYEEMRPGYVEALPLKLKELESFLGDRDWLAGGDGPTFADFYGYEILAHHRRFEPKLMADHPKLEAYLSRFQALPRVRAYLDSDRFAASPINAPGIAKWYQ